MPRRGLRFQPQQGEKPAKRFRSGVRQFILKSPMMPLSQEEVRNFILQTDLPPQWGPAMEQELRNRLTADGFQVTRCRCLETHPVVAIRLRGPAELELREMKQRIRKLAKDLGHRAPPGGMAITGRAGRFDGAFVMEAEFPVGQVGAGILA